MLKKIIKKLLPRKALLLYYHSLAKIAGHYYSNPSEKLIVIGVTGTNGKTTTVNLISQLLEALGQKTGFASTVNFKVGEKEWLNHEKMTMLGRFKTQKLMKQMVEEGCKYAIIETSSQGIEQHRHSNINYDIVVFTNLTPEHIEAHGGFLNYRASKEKLFQHLGQSQRKFLNQKRIDKVTISNADDEETKRLSKIKVDRFVTYGFDNSADYHGHDISLDDGFVSFKLKENLFHSIMIGKFNAYNYLASLAAVRELGFSLDKLVNCRTVGVPGRQELIEQGQDFKIMVDYAPEPVSLRSLYDTLNLIIKKRIIHVLGSCGGGRDRARQPIMGKIAATRGSIVIVTNEDPYDDDPWEIINNVAKGAILAGKVKGKDLFTILDREEAIKKALTLAEKDDLVLITGKGAEQFICVANDKKIPWDDRRVVKKLLKDMGK